jgi:hypothetical protein
MSAPRLLSSANILCVRNNLHVIWIYAPAISAKMVNHIPFWNFSTKQRIREAMSQISMTTNAKSPIPVAVYISGPLPTISVDKHVLEEVEKRTVAHLWNFNDACVHFISPLSRSERK